MIAFVSIIFCFTNCNDTSMYVMYNLNNFKQKYLKIYSSQPNINLFFVINVSYYIVNIVPIQLDTIFYQYII